MAKIRVQLMTPGEVCSVNGYTKKADDNGIIEFDPNEVLVQENKGLYEFDFAVESEGIMSKSQRIAFYTLISDWTQFGKKDVMNCVGVLEKEVVDRIVDLACMHGVVGKINSQWRSKAIMREQVKAYLTRIQAGTLKMNERVQEKVETVEALEEVKLKDKNAISESELPTRVSLKKKPITIPKKKGK